MNFFERLTGWRRFRRQGGPRRVILLDIIGLEPRSVDHYLGEGLLHNLALMSDVGTRQELTHARDAIVAEFERAASDRQLRVQKLSGPSAPATDLSDVCRDDENRQTELIETLKSAWSGLLVARFDMPHRLQRLFGARPTTAQQLVLRDVYARMDEIVGKAFSVVDDATALAVFITAAAASHTSCDTRNGSLFFYGRPLKSVPASPAELAAALFDAAPNDRQSQAT